MAGLEAPRAGAQFPLPLVLCLLSLVLTKTDPNYPCLQHHAGIPSVPPKALEEGPVLTGTAHSLCSPVLPQNGQSATCSTLPLGKPCWGFSAKQNHHLSGSLGALRYSPLDPESSPHPIGLKIPEIWVPQI